MASFFRAFVLLAPLLAVACEAPDPKAELELSEIETYWVVDPSRAGTTYIAPAVRFRLRNKGEQERRSVQATANFRRAGETQVWSTGFWQQRGPAGTTALAPGGTATVTLRPDGEGRYTSTGPPESLFRHERFKDVWAEVFLKIGPSGWVKFVERADVERRIGSKDVPPEVR